MNLPSLYARVCAKRPELAFVYLRHDGACWTTGKTIYCDSTVAALILPRWLEALPVHAGLMRGLDNPKGNPRWYVDGPQHLHPCADTPIEALAAFYLVEQ